MPGVLDTAIFDNSGLPFVTLDVNASVAAFQNNRTTGDCFIEGVGTNYSFTATTIDLGSSTACYLDIKTIIATTITGSSAVRKSVGFDIVGSSVTATNVTLGNNSVIIGETVNISGTLTYGNNSFVGVSSIIDESFTLGALVLGTGCIIGSSSGTKIFTLVSTANVAVASAIIRNCHASGGTFNADADSYDIEGNTGWTFAAHGTTIINGSTEDGDIYGTTLNDKAGQTNVVGSESSQSIDNQYEFNMCLYFDTSAIGAGSTISKCKLYFWVTAADSDSSYIDYLNIYFCDGDAGSTIEGADLNTIKTNGVYTAFGWKATPININAGAKFLTLGAGSLTQINKSGWTNVAIDAVWYASPASSAYIHIASQENSNAAWRPYLEVTFTAATGGPPRQVSLAPSRLRFGNEDSNPRIRL
jgi:hypothetical protein